MVGMIYAIGRTPIRRLFMRLINQKDGLDLKDLVIEQQIDESRFIDVDKGTFDKVLISENYYGVKALRAFETTNFGYILLDNGKIIRC